MKCSSLFPQHNLHAARIWALGIYLTFKNVLDHSPDN